MCRMDFIQDAHEKGEKSDQPHVSKLPVSQLGWPSSDHQSPGHLLSCSPIFCGGVGIKEGALCAAPPLGAAVWECRCCSRCSLPSLAERVLGKHLHPWNECSASHPEARNYSSLVSSRLEKCNPFSLEANPLDLASLNNMLPPYKISFLSPF